MRSSDPTSELDVRSSQVSKTTHAVCELTTILLTFKPIRGANPRHWLVLPAHLKGRSRLQKTLTLCRDLTYLQALYFLYLYCANMSASFNLPFYFEVTIKAKQ